MKHDITLAVGTFVLTGIWFAAMAGYAVATNPIPPRPRLLNLQTLTWEPARCVTDTECVRMYGDPPIRQPAHP